MAFDNLADHFMTQIVISLSPLPHFTLAWNAMKRKATLVVSVCDRMKNCLLYLYCLLFLSSYLYSSPSLDQLVFKFRLKCDIKAKLVIRNRKKNKHTNNYKSCLKPKWYFFMVLFLLCMRPSTLDQCNLIFSLGFFLLLYRFAAQHFMYFWLYSFTGCLYRMQFVYVVQKIIYAHTNWSHFVIICWRIAVLVHRVGKKIPR